MLLKDLLESVGFPNRRQGDEFYNPKDETDTSTFVELILWPDTSEKQFETPEQRNEALKNFQSQVKGEVYVVNKPNNGMLGLYIVHMLTKDVDEYYVRYVKNVRSSAGIMTDIPAGAKPGHGGYKFGSKTARKEAYAIKPSSVFTSEGPYEPAQIANALKNASGIPDDLKSQMVSYITELSKGNKDFVIQDGEKYRSIHENYTGEFAAPIAVITGQVIPPGVLLKAEEALLGGEKFANCKIIFPLDVSNALTDSELVAPNGRKVGVSSKAKTGGGAAASLAGLYATIELKKNDADFKQVMDTYPDFINLVETVATMSAPAGFIQLCLEQKLIDENDASVIATEIKKAKQGNKSTLEDLTPRLQNLLPTYGADTDKPLYNVIYHATAALSRFLELKLNDTDPTEAVKALLNFSTLTQVYAGTSKSGADIRMNEFKFVWPPVFEGKVNINTSKNFDATGIRGKISFKFKK